MTTNMNKLFGKIAEQGYTKTKFVAELGMDYSTFCRKTDRNGESFTIGEAHRICDLLSLSPTDATDIFLSQDSQ